MNSSPIVAKAVAAHRAELVAFVERRLGSRALAEDIVQQAATRALEHADGLRDSRSGRAWLYRITRRLVADHFRQRVDASFAAELNAEQELADCFGCSCVLANLEQLKPDQALLLRRVLVEALPLGAVAAEIGLSLNAVTVRLSRARAALREQLRVHCGTQSLRDCLECACDARGCCDIRSDDRGLLGG